MNRHGQTRLAACALPLLLALAAQGGSCGDGGAARGRRDANSATNAKAANAGTNAGAGGRGGEAGMNQGGKSDGAAAGTWGGTGVRLEVGAGGAEVEFDCAHGTLGRLALDAGGGFDVAGTFTRERGGPVRSDEEPEKLPARYSGKVEGDRMTLRVAAEGIEETLTYTLTRGNAGRLRKCL
jgi:hypothetical protein